MATSKTVSKTTKPRVRTRPVAKKPDSTVGALFSSPSDTIKAEVLAEALNRSGKVVRAWLRRNFARAAEAKGSSWAVTRTMAVAAEAHFNKSADTNADADANANSEKE